MRVCHCRAAINRAAFRCLRTRLPSQKTTRAVNATYITRASGTARSLCSQIKHPIPRQCLQGSRRPHVDHDGAHVSTIKCITFTEMSCWWDSSLGRILKIVLCFCSAHRITQVVRNSMLLWDARWEHAHAHVEKKIIWDYKLLLSVPII